MDIGYVRVSTVGQNEGRQLETMSRFVENERYIFVDKATGKNFDRDGYNAMKSTLREGDVLYVDSLDRLGRNYDLIKREWFDITQNLKCDIVCVDMIDTFNSLKFKEMGAVGKVMQDMMLSMLSYVAETELRKNHERQAQGIALAKAQGKYKGRKPIECNDKFYMLTNLWVNGNMPLKDCISELGMSKSTFFRKCKQYGIRKPAAN